MPHPRYASSEIAERGQRLYDEQIRELVESEHRGKFLVVDIETGDYEIDENELAAINRARARNPDAALYLLRVGHPTAHRLRSPRLLPPS